MIVTIKGMLIDKFEKEQKKDDGTKQKVARALIYQPENHKTVEVGISFETYNKIEKNKVVSITCNIGAFLTNKGVVLLYAKETDKF